MPSPSTAVKGLVTTNPLVIYRALVASKKIQPDPSQHRLAIHLEKLYEQLKDYKPSRDFKAELDRIRRFLNVSPQVGDSVDAQSAVLAQGPTSLFSKWRGGQDQQHITALARRLTDHEAAIQINSPRGLLLHGEVGAGKSLLVDLLADNLPNAGRRRWHFNTFMQEVYSRLERNRKQMKVTTHDSALEYSMISIARDLIMTTPILFLDEFQLPDRATSKILSNLLTCFFHLGGVLVATSNRMPEELARASGIEFAAPSPASGIQNLAQKIGLVQPASRQVVGSGMTAGQGDFVAFLEVLKARCEVWNIESQKDWRREEQHQTPSSGAQSSPQDGVQSVDDLEESLRTDDSRIDSEGLGSQQALAALPKYFVHVSETMSRPPTSLLNMLEQEVLSDVPLDGIEWTKDSVQVYGRTLVVPGARGQTCKWTFDELCAASYGPADYLTLASRFHSFIITDIPVLTQTKRNEARRFITLIDALYEARCKLIVCSAARPDELFFPSAPGRAEETRHSPDMRPEDRVVSQDEVYPETMAEIYQDQTSPFRPNVSAYTASASFPSYADSSNPTSASQLSRARSILADEDSDFGPVYGAGRSQGASTWSEHILRDENPRPNFTNTLSYTGEDERFAYKRAVSRLWEMCGLRWWARRGDWWRPLRPEERIWERSGSTSLSAQESVSSSDVDPQTQATTPTSESFSPFRTHSEPPPKFSWTHAWGMIKWGRKAGAWGQGPEGLAQKKAKRDLSVSTR